MLSKADALQLVAQHLGKMAPSGDSLIVVDQDTIERPFGWVFFYQSQRHLDTGEFQHRLAGNGPVIVNKWDATIEFFGARQPVSEIITDYERRLAGH